MSPWRQHTRRTITHGGHVIAGFDRERVRYLLEHRVVMERHIRRALTDGEVVHHVNLDKTDNSISNLYLCADRGEHMRVHRSVEALLPKLLRAAIVRFNSTSGVYEYCGG